MTYTDHLISLGIGIAGYFLALLIHRIWSQITMTEIQRRLKQYETEKAKLDNLSRSDRALIIHGFQGVFAAFALLFIIFAFQWILANKDVDDPLNGREILRLATWILASLVCIGGAVSLKQIANYPESVEKIDKKIAKLKDKLLGK